MTAKEQAKRQKKLKWERYYNRREELCNQLFQKHIEVPIMADVVNEDLEKLLNECDDYIPELKEAVKNGIYVSIIGYDYDADTFEYCLR